MTTIDFSAQAQALRQELIERRRDFHQHPELAFEEVRTAGIVARELSNLGMEVRAGVGKTGVVAMLEGAHEGPTVLMRADMDALPIHEENEVDYASTAPGKMHACGHDGHTAIMLGVARLLSPLRDQMAGRIKFVFQPAEEIALGAKAMCDDDVLTDPRPDVSLGLHLWNSLPSGTLGIGDGPVMAGASNFSVMITGKGSHGASPHEGVDPVVCAAALVSAFQTIVSRSVDPLDTAVVSVTYMRAGEAYNVIPQTAELRGTIRAFRTEVRDLVVDRMRESTEHLCRAMRCSGQITVTHLTEPVVNHAEVTQRARQIFGTMPGVTKLDTTERTMGAEDVGFFMDDIPGLFFFLGAQDAAADAYYGHHHPRFSFDEDMLPLGVALLASAAASYVLPEG